MQEYPVWRADVDLQVDLQYEREGKEGQQCALHRLLNHIA